VPRATERISHHDLCFGCGQANLFGLQLELERREAGGVAGRFFVKQDHQGPPGYAHGGVLATALDEAMSLLLHDQGTFALTGRLEVELRAPAPVGGFVEVEADVEEADGRRVVAAATAKVEGREVANARGTFVEVAPPESPP
jgi:acyl-coenzyme A thioesterase PaaI-like protein